MRKFKGWLARYQLAALMSKLKDQFARYQDNVSEWCNICLHADCCFSMLALWKFNQSCWFSRKLALWKFNQACWCSRKRTSPRRNISCYWHDIAATLFTLIVWLLSPITDKTVTRFVYMVNKMNVVFYRLLFVIWSVSFWTLGPSWSWSYCSWIDN